MSQYDASDFATNNFCHATYAYGRTKESLCNATKTFSRLIKQLLHQCHKVLAMSNIKGELASSFSLNIACSQYLVVFMEYLIKIIHYKTLFCLIPQYILTHSLVFGSTKGWPNTFKTQNIMRY